eukprot:jgi/Tetstr1/436693/TSEL_002721.t1
MPKGAAASALRSLEERKQYRFVPVGGRDESGVAVLPTPSTSKPPCTVSHGRRRGQAAPNARSMQLLDMSSSKLAMMEGLVGPEEEMLVKQEAEKGGFYQPRIIGAVSRSSEEAVQKQAVQKARPWRRIGDNGYKTLKDAISSSDARKKTVRHGTSLTQAVKQDRGARSDGHRGEGNPRKRKPGRAASKHQPQLKLPVLVEAPSPTGEAREGAGGLLDSFFNPEVAVKGITEDFDRMQGSAVQRLGKVLGKMDESRAAGLETKFSVLYNDMRGGRSSRGHVAPEVTSERWRLAAEKQRLESKLKAFVDHQWFLKLMATVSQNGRQMTMPEEHIMSEIKKIVELGQMFDVLDFLTMVACVPRSYHNSDGVQHIFEFLRQKVDVKGEEYRDFLEQRNLPVPAALAKITSQKKRSEWVSQTRSSRPGSEGNPFAEDD